MNTHLIRMAELFQPRILCVIEIQEISFEFISGVWAEKLWPKRVSAIEPVSAINEHGIIDAEILKYPPVFWGAFVEKKLVGVISCHPTSKENFRLRGIFVDEEYRSLKIGKLLIEQVVSHADTNGASLVWALVRQSNRDYFTKFDFKVLNETSAYEFGPHFLMGKRLKLPPIGI